MGGQHNADDVSHHLFRLPLKRYLPQLTAVALLLATAFPDGAGAGVAFSKSFKLHGISFQVQFGGEGSQQQLWITTTGTRSPIKLIQPICQGVSGQVVGA